MALDRGTTFTWYGHSCWEISTPGGRTILLDPWFANPRSPKKQEQVERCDLLLVSHGHFDHMGTGDAVALARRLGPTWPCIHELSLYLGDLGLPGEVIRRVARGDERVHRRIPGCIVHAVEDAEEVRGAVAEHAVEPGPEFLSLDLAGVRLAHRTEDVGEVQAALEQVHLSPELQPPRREHRRGQPRERKLLGREESLVGEVVDREERGRAPALGGEDDRDERGLPVVAVDDVGLPALRADPLQQRAGEERETGEVVVVVMARFPIEPRAIEQRGLIDEPEREMAPGQPGIHHRPRYDRFADAHLHGPRALLRDRDAAIARHRHAHVHAARSQRRGKGAGDIGQPAGLRQRDDLGGTKQDSHRCSLRAPGRGRLIRAR